MIEPIVIAILALLLQVWDSIFKPRTASCPSGFFVEGVRPTGETRCLPVPPPNCGEPRPPHDQPCPDDPRSLELRVWCESDELAVVVDERTISCSRSRAAKRKEPQPGRAAAPKQTPTKEK